MKSFPGTANEGKLMYNSTLSQTYKDTFDIERIKALNLNSSVPVIKEMLNEKNINAGNFQVYPAMHTIRVNDIIKADDTYDDRIYYEDPLRLPAEIISLAKDYEWVYKYQVKTLLSAGEKNDKSIKTQLINTNIVPSMFNPMYGVNAVGLIRNTPLLNDIEDNELDPNIDDCSIRTLCTLSKNPNSPLGAQTYKYADFMYCKDLGKVANNHLITLRRFAHPVPDHIGKGWTPAMNADGASYSWQAGGDIGRLVTWFGTDDNKLEDICKFSYHATWKELTAQIEEQDSKADDKRSGILGMISNSLNPNYNRSVNAGQTGEHSIFGWLASKISPATMQGIGSNNDLLRNYDNNKVYTPSNTIQTNHIYEGKLEFSHEFTLVFSYKLRGYDNINPRSAFLDLIGNVLEVTYRRGKFWGGSRKLIGPAQDNSVHDKVGKFIDNRFKELGGLLSSIQNSGINFKQILGSLGSALTNGANAIFNSIKEAANGNGSEIVQNLGNSIKNIATTSGFMEAAKGYLKNALGRPQLYAWQSLIKQEDVGLWHVTVGNPKNPILSIGNLILVDASIQQFGPLGVDDFPSELKVSVTLKHARPRDVTDIGRMYTQGTSALYMVLAGHNLTDFYGSTSGYSDVQAQNEKTADDKKTKAQDNKNQNSNGGKEDPAVQTAKSGDEKKLNELVNDDINKANANGSSGEYYISSAGAYMNPLLTSDSEISFVRKNTYSDVIFARMMQEAA